MNRLSTIDCVHFGPCSGCSLSQGVDQPPCWEVMQKFFSKHKCPKPLLYRGAICGWRTKAKLAVRGTMENPIIGLFKSGSHDALAIPHCQVHHPAINRAVAHLTEALREEKIPPYDEKNGLLRYIQCLVDLRTEKIQLTLVWNGTQPTLAMNRLADRLLQSDLWHSIWFNFQPKVTNRIFGDAWHLHSGPPFLKQSLSSLEIPFHPAAFSQAHWTLFETLATHVSAAIPPDSRLLEIYSGVGALGRLAAPRSLSVDLIESNPFAHLSFQSMPSEPNVRFHRREAKEAISFLPEVDCVIVDPPRKGLDPELLEALKEWEGRLIYVSCSFESLQRDVEQLLSSGWILKKGDGYLLFPGTDHVEIAIFLERASK